jgi:hypothetical protein
MSVKYYRDVPILTPREIWTSTTTTEVQFVDGDYGGNNNAGWTPKKAVASITQAVTNITGMRQAVIYVRPKGNSTTSGQSYYTDNVTVPLTTPNLSIIGAGSTPRRPFLGVDVKATTSTSPLFTVNGSGLCLESMRLTGTGQNATDGIAIIYAKTSATSNGSVGLQAYQCRFDNAKTGGAFTFDSPNHVEILECSFDECAISITTLMSYGGVASRGLKIVDCDFGGRIATRDMDIYISQSGAGTGAGVTGYEIRGCRFLDALPTKGDNNRFIKIANGDTGMIVDCRFPITPGSNHIATYGAAGSECIIPTSWAVVATYGPTDIDFIHPAAA